MALEIERKFLVEGPWPVPPGGGMVITQGYLPLSEGFAGEARVRLARLPSGATKAWLTRKSEGGLVRTEEEEEISENSARAMLAKCGGNILEKVRHALPLGDGLVLEVDVYAGALSGLVVAEVELPSIDAAVSLPAWLGREITEDRAYKNKSLALDGRPASALVQIAPTQAPAGPSSKAPRR